VTLAGVLVVQLGAELIVVHLTTLLLKYLKASSMIGVWTYGVLESSLMNS
jgi:hypothetical protein